jgi:hypothetical protein
VFYLTDAEMLFPVRVIPSLRNLRGADWKSLVDQLSIQSETDPDVLAFALMMIRLSTCMTCHSDSYRAMRGCTVCASQTISRFKGTDDELIKLWQAARLDIEAYFTAGRVPKVD